MEKNPLLIPRPLAASWFIQRFQEAKQQKYLLCGTYWIRTSDLLRVKQAL